MTKQEHEEVANGLVGEFTNELKFHKTEYQNTPKFSKIRFILLMVGIALSIFIAFLDDVTAAVTMPVIVSEFNAMGQIARVVVVYHLTATAMQPLYGKMSDIFGRKLVVMAALTCHLIGLILSGTSQSVTMLIIARAFCGIGGGGLVTLSLIIISDVVPMKDRAIFMTMVGVIYAIAEIVGPLMSGGFTDNLSWRWIFYIIIPICVITIVLVITFLSLPQPQGNVKVKVKRVDFLGTITLASSIICLILALSWGGNEFKWDQWQILLPLILSLLLLTAFVVIELKLAIEPIITFNIFNRNTIIALTINFFHGILGMSCSIYIPLYYQVIHKFSVTEAAVRYLPYLLSNVLGNIVNGIVMTKTGIYRPISWAGTTLATIGIILLGSLMRSGITMAEEFIYVILIGFGIGLCYQVNTIISQAVAKEEDVGIVTSMVLFANMLGRVFGVAIQGAIFTGSLANALTPLFPSLDIKTVTSSIQNIRALPLTDQLTVNTGYYHALITLYLIMIPTAVIPLIASLFLHHIPLRSQR